MHQKGQCKTKTKQKGKVLSLLGLGFQHNCTFIYFFLICVFCWLDISKQLQGDVIPAMLKVIFASKCL